jgi:hypothetical protein
MILIKNRYASVHSDGAALPSISQDLNPLGTTALYNLWEGLRPFVHLESNSPEFRMPDNKPGITPAIALTCVGDLLVSLLALGQLFLFTNSFFQLAYDQALEDPLGNTLESEVGYRVRLWALFLLRLCTSHADRPLLTRYSATLLVESISAFRLVSNFVLRLFE